MKCLKVFYAHHGCCTDVQNHLISSDSLISLEVNVAISTETLHNKRRTLVHSFGRGKGTKTVHLCSLDNVWKNVTHCQCGLWACNGSHAGISSLLEHCRAERHGGFATSAAHSLWHHVIVVLPSTEPAARHYYKLDCHALHNDVVRTAAFCDMRSACQKHEKCSKLNCWLTSW